MLYMLYIVCIFYICNVLLGILRLVGAMCKSYPYSKRFVQIYKWSFILNNIIFNGVFTVLSMVIFILHQIFANSSDRTHCRFSNQAETIIELGFALSILFIILILHGYGYLKIKNCPKHQFRAFVDLISFHVGSFSLFSIFVTIEILLIVIIRCPFIFFMIVHRLMGNRKIAEFCGCNLVLNIRAVVIRYLQRCVSIYEID